MEYCSISSSITINNTGTYWVIATNGCMVYADTFRITIAATDTTYHSTNISACVFANPVTLYSPIGYSSHLWNTGSTSSYIVVNSPGTYWVASKIANCGLRLDIFHVTITSLVAPLVKDTLACGPVTLTVPLNNASYLWSDGSTEQSIIINRSGQYNVKITANGCFVFDTVNVSILELTQHFEDSVVCLDIPFSISLNSNAPPGSLVTWSTGSTNTSITVTDTGKYWLFVKDRVCTGTDTVNYKGDYCNCICFVPAAFTPNHDGKNETIRPLLKNECNVSNYTFSIFDRWGAVVFTSHDPRLPGTVNLKGYYMK